MQARLGARASQDRGWAAPMPDFSKLPRNNESARVRVEWETRDTTNNRLYSDIITIGPKAVTTAMLASHPTNGAEPFMPTVSRRDQNNYVESTYFPNSNFVDGRQERPRLPSLSQNAYISDLDPEDLGGITREVRQSVVEDNRYRNENTDSRILERVFTHKLITAEMTKSIIDRQLDAAEALRSRSDDWLRPVD